MNLSLHICWFFVSSNLSESKLITLLSQIAAALSNAVVIVDLLSGGGNKIVVGFILRKIKFS